jgi:hypothetical protein
MRLPAVLFVAAAFLSAAPPAAADAEAGIRKHHHKHHHKHHKHHHKSNATHAANSTPKAAAAKNMSGAMVEDAIVKTNGSSVVSSRFSKKVNATLTAKSMTGSASENQIMLKLRSLEEKLTAGVPGADSGPGVRRGELEVNGPVPANFAVQFAVAVAKATGCSPSVVRLLDSMPTAQSQGLLDELLFEAPGDVVDAVQDQAADPSSLLANGALHMYLVARDSSGQAPDVVQEADGSTVHSVDMDVPDPAAPGAAPPPGAPPPGAPPPGAPQSMSLDAPPPPPPPPQAPCDKDGLDIDTSMPYGDLEPFGREDTAQELTESSIRESDEMVDQLERAEVAEEKRAVFRALTRLRGAAITSFDGVARSQTGNIDEYAKVHKWRMTHPLHHLANEESDITKWAFPNNADF